MLKLDKGSLRFTDQMVAMGTTTASTSTATTGIATLLKNIKLEAGALSLHGDAPTTFNVSLVSEDGANIESRGRAVIARLQVRRRGA